VKAGISIADRLAAMAAAGGADRRRARVTFTVVIVALAKAISAVSLQIFTPCARDPGRTHRLLCVSGYFGSWSTAGSFPRNSYRAGLADGLALLVLTFQSCAAKALCLRGGCEQDGHPLDGGRRRRGSVPDRPRVGFIALSSTSQRVVTVMIWPSSACRSVPTPM
jgi:hypothetical protein